MNFRWIWFIAARSVFRRQKKSPSPVLSVLGIATGVFALIVIIAVMNGFQLGFIESILEISSYHLRVGPVAAVTTEEAGAALLAIPGVEAAVPFREFQALIRGRRGGQQAALVRGLPPDAPLRDAAMTARLEFEEGFFDLSGERSVLLGAELARRLGVRTGHEISLYSIPALFADSDEYTGLRTFTVTGLFRTGFYEYDTGWAFVNIESAAAFSDAGAVMGLKLKNRFHDQKMLELARTSLEGQTGLEQAEFTSWRDYNRSFFGALRTEKLFMFILVGLIFIVVGLNIYQAQRRSVLEHREEIGLLRAVGGGDRAVRMIFVCDGAIIGFTGASTGLILGLLAASHIPLFFTVIEHVVNFFIDIVNNIAGFFDAEGVGGFSLFSPAVFYIKEIPSRIIPQEAVLIFMFGLFSALLAAWFASRKTTRILVAEVLRYE
ncbi:MAG: ABC transporter permease [Treponema sp.]|jgi:lipoprotein-releasing system permease protein|nr:ABC transporter permease [Treponema sp.]